MAIAGVLVFAVSDVGSVFSDRLLCVDLIADLSPSKRSLTTCWIWPTEEQRVMDLTLESQGIVLSQRL